MRDREGLASRGPVVWDVPYVIGQEDQRYEDAYRKRGGHWSPRESAGLDHERAEGNQKSPHPENSGLAKTMGFQDDRVSSVENTGSRTDNADDQDPDAAYQGQ